MSVLLAAYDEGKQEAHLYMVDPAGVGYRYKGCAVGKARQASKTMVEKLDGSQLTCREALKQLAKILHTTHDDVKDKPFEFERAGFARRLASSMKSCQRSSGWQRRSGPKTKSRRKTCQTRTAMTMTSKMSYYTFVNT